MKILTDTGDYEVYFNNFVYTPLGTFVFKGGYKTCRKVYVCLSPDEVRPQVGIINTIMGYFSDYEIEGEPQVTAFEDKVGIYVSLNLVKAEEFIPGAPAGGGGAGG